MKTDPIELRAWLVAESTLAIYFSDDPLANKHSMCTFCVPRSLISYLRKQEESVKGAKHTRIIFKLPEWKVEQSWLWSFAK